MELFRQAFHEPGAPLRHANWLFYVPQGVFHDDSIFSAAEQQADGRLIVAVAELIVHGREVEIHLSREFGFESLHFQIHDHETPKAEVVEEQIEKIFLASDFQTILASDKGKANAQLDEEFLNVIEQPEFQFALARCGIEREKVENVGVLERLRGEVGLRRGESGGEVGQDRGYRVDFAPVRKP